MRWKLGEMLGALRLPSCPSAWASMGSPFLWSLFIQITQKCSLSKYCMPGAWR